MHVGQQADVHLKNAEAERERLQTKTKELQTQLLMNQQALAAAEQVFGAVKSCLHAPSIAAAWLLAVQTVSAGRRRIEVAQGRDRGVGVTIQVVVL